MSENAKLPAKNTPNRGVQVAILAITTLTFLFALEAITLHTADLGRHLMNGKMVLEQGDVIRTNTYSFTQPEQPVVTHHWGTGVLFYLTHQIGGYEALSFVYALSAALGVFFMLLAARRVADWWVVLPLAVVILPLYAGRAEVRPEGFSFLLFGLSAWLMLRFRGQAFPRWLLPTLIALQVLWVNLHLFFILGALFAGLMWLDSLIQKDQHNKQWLVLTLGMSVACLVNPWFIEGALQPFMILNEYGYMIAENKSVLFMQNRAVETYENALTTNPNAELPASYYRYWHFHLAVGATAILALIALVKSKPKSLFAPVVLLVCFVGLAYNAIRGIPLFALAAIPALAWLIQATGVQLSVRMQRGAVIAAIALTGLMLAVPNTYFSGLQYQEVTVGQATQRKLWQSSFGLRELEVAGDKLIDQEAAARFVRQNNLPGPIFNNYDIGGYLIWALYPDYKVFVDNRPEAYTVEFFTELYKPMQQDEVIWARESKRYGIQTIVFYRHDMTEWGQAFLVNRAKDVVHWAPVFIDGSTIIFVKREPQNTAIIRQYEPVFGPQLGQYRTEGMRKLQELQRQQQQQAADDMDLSVPDSLRQ